MSLVAPSAISSTFAMSAIARSITERDVDLQPYRDGSSRKEPWNPDTRDHEP